jgi:hypothetical protein
VKHGCGGEGRCPRGEAATRQASVLDALSKKIGHDLRPSFGRAWDQPVLCFKTHSTPFALNFPGDIPTGSAHHSGERRFSLRTVLLSHR